MYRQVAFEALLKLLAAMWLSSGGEATTYSVRRLLNRRQSLQHPAVQLTDPTSRCRAAKRALTAQSYVLVLIPFQSLIDLLAAVVGPHFLQHKEIRID